MGLDGCPETGLDGRPDRGAGGSGTACGGGFRSGSAIHFRLDATLFLKRRLRRCGKSALEIRMLRAMRRGLETGYGPD
jgi:hypothetical protein